MLRGNVRGLLLTACYPGISCDVKDSFGQLQGLCDGKNFTSVNFSHPLMHSSPSFGTSSLQDLCSDLHERFP